MSKSKTFLHGIVPPVATPYTADNQIDWKSLSRLLKHLLDGGVQDLFGTGGRGHRRRTLTNHHQLPELPPPPPPPENPPPEKPPPLPLDCDGAVWAELNEWA